MKTYYEILGIDKTATKAEVKLAYKKMAAIHHPDKPTGDAKAFNDVKEAFDVLYHDGHRAEYDETGTYTKPENNDSKVIELLQNLFIGAIADYEIDGNFNIIERMKNITNKSIDLHKENISKSKLSIDKLSVMKGKIKHKSDGNNIFEMFLDKKIKSFEADIATRENGILLNELMLEQLENFIMESNALSLNPDVSEIDRYNKAQQSKPPFQWFGKGMMS